MRRGKKIDQRGRSKGDAKHVRLYASELNSPAYRDLSCVARSLYVEMKFFYNGCNNGELYMSVRTAAERLNVSDNTAAKALRELEVHGFIRPQVKGAFTRKMRHATSWVLSEYAFRENVPTRDYQWWHLGGKKQNTVSNFALSVLKSDTETSASCEVVAQ